MLTDQSVKLASNVRSYLQAKMCSCQAMCTGLAVFCGTNRQHMEVAHGMCTTVQVTFMLQ